MIPPPRVRRAALPPGAVHVLVPGLVLVMVTGLAGCSHTIGTTSDRAGATPKAMAACRQRADEVFARRNPADVYRSDMNAGGLRDAPFGGMGVPGNATDGLSARYSRETILDDCLNGASGSAEVSPSPDAPAAATAAGASPPVPPAAKSRQ